MLTCPDNKFISADGIKKGLIFLGPFEFKSSEVLEIVSRPPIPEPKITPVLFFWFSLFGFQPESSTAWVADMRP